MHCRQGNRTCVSFVNKWSGGAMLAFGLWQRHETASPPFGRPCCAERSRGPCQCLHIECFASSQHDDHVYTTGMVTSMCYADMPDEHPVMTTHRFGIYRWVLGPSQSSFTVFSLLFPHAGAPCCFFTCASSYSQPKTSCLLPQVGI